MGDAPQKAAGANLKELINLEFLPKWARDSDVSTRDFDGAPRAAPPRGGRTERARHSARGERFGGEPSRREGRRGHSERFARAPAPRVAPVRPPPGVEIAILPEPRALQAVADQVKASGRAYPLFALGRMFVARPERYRVRFRATGAEGGPSALLQCVACGAVARAAGDLVRHVIERHRAEHYREETASDAPPKGNFTAVARCTLNGALLGPTNHHSYQAALLKLHRSRFASMSLERFKASIVLDRDPAAVEAWRRQASLRTTYLPLHGEAPSPISTEADLERDFRANRLAGCSREGAEFTVDGAVGRESGDDGLRAAVRAMVAEEAAFPQRLIRLLAAALTRAGLVVFRGARSMLFVAPARPAPFLADPTHVAPEVWAILEYVRKHPRRGRGDLVRALCPPEASRESAPPDGAPDARLATFLGHLDWLVRQGHLIEYFNGELERVAAPTGAPSSAAHPRPSRRQRRRRHAPHAQAKPAPTAEAPQPPSDAPLG